MRNQNTYDARDGVECIEEGVEKAESYPYALVPHLICPFRGGCGVGQLRFSNCPAVASLRQVPKRAMVAMEGSRREGLIAVLQGVLKVYKSLSDGRTQIVGLRFPGETVTARDSDNSWQVSVEAVEPAIICILDRKTVRRIKRDNPDFTALLNEHAGREVADAQEHLLTVGRKTPVERVASLLVELDRRKMRPNKEDAEELALPITRVEIGDLLGLENETVSRVFTKLKAAGFIGLNGPSHIRIRDLESLVRLSRGEPVEFPAKIAS